MFQRFLLLFTSVFLPISAMEYNPPSLKFKVAKFVAKKVSNKEIEQKLPEELQEYVKFLIKHYNFREAFRVAVEHSQDKQLIADLIEELGAGINRPDKNGMTLFMHAAKAGNEIAVQSCINKNIDINGHNKDGYTPLMFAASSGNVELCKYLVEQGADSTKLDNAGTTAFIHAICQDKTDVAQYLLVKDNLDINALYGSPIPDINLYGSLTPFMWASLCGKVKACRWVLEKGINVNLQNHQGFSALSLAYLEANKSDAKQIKTLLEEYGFSDDLQQRNERLKFRTLIGSYVFIMSLVPMTFIGLGLYNLYDKFFKR